MVQKGQKISETAGFRFVKVRTSDYDTTGRVPFFTGSGLVVERESGGGAMALAEGSWRGVSRCAVVRPCTGTISRPLVAARARIHV